MKIFAPIPILLLLASCAIQKPPSGGPVDKEAPVIENAIPENKNLEFNTKKIELYFNEYISLRNPINEILISPPMPENPKYTVKGKMLSIELMSALEDSTTYTIQFGDAIVDLTEGNIVRNYQYVFSTGKVIDSLCFKGSVKDAFSDEPIDNIIILLYEEGCDSCIFMKKPRYFARSDKSGTYSFYNIKAGKYLVYAIGDENRNYYFNEGEVIGFIAESIDIQKDTTITPLIVFRNEEKHMKLISKYGVKPSKIELKYNKEIDLESVALLKDKKEIPCNTYYLGESRDSIIVWSPEFQQDTVMMLVKIIERGVDTITIYMREAKENKPSLEIRQGFNLYGKREKVSLRSSEPIVNVNRELILIYEDSLLIDTGFSFEMNEEDPLFLDIIGIFKPGKLYRFYFNKSSLEGISGKINDSCMFNFILRSDSELGKISININSDNSEDDYLIYLTTFGGRIIRVSWIKPKKEVNTINFENLKPGNYKIRFVKDENRNGRWDTGDIYSKRNAEKVYYLEQKIELKSNWEINDLNFTVP